MIGITSTASKFNVYLNWLEHYGVEYEILDFDKPAEGYEAVEKCSGIIFTGGVDIYPELYCDWDTTETKGTYNPARDGFELKLLEKVLEMRIPVLAICRGMQLVNIYFRGSLIFDLEEIRNVNHRKISDTEDRMHNVKIFENTLLHSIIGKDEIDVTSSHHQAVDRLGEGLMVNAKSGDGIIEGIEFANKDSNPFFLGIQWHPERFKDFKNPGSEDILEKFRSECYENA